MNNAVRILIEDQRLHLSHASIRTCLLLLDQFGMFELGFPSPNAGSYIYLKKVAVALTQTTDKSGLEKI